MSRIGQEMQDILLRLDGLRRSVRATTASVKELEMQASELREKVCELADLCGDHKPEEQETALVYFGDTQTIKTKP